MCALFFMCAFCNSLLDPIADTLVVTALGGAEQIPFLSLYGVLPASFLFVVGARRGNRLKEQSLSARRTAFSCAVPAMRTTRRALTAASNSGRFHEAVELVIQKTSLQPHRMSLCLVHRSLRRCAHLCSITFPCQEEPSLIAPNEPCIHG